MSSLFLTLYLVKRINKVQLAGRVEYDSEREKVVEVTAPCVKRAPIKCDKSSDKMGLLYIKRKSIVKINI